MGNRDGARSATIISFKNRVCGNMALVDGSKISPQSKIVYQGGYPYQGIADSVALPKSYDINDHRNCWRELYSIFDQTWREHVSKGGS